MEDFIHNLLTQRGIVTEEDRDRFFNPNYERDLHDPFLLKDMDAAVVRIVAAIENKEKIAIYSDFDADGIPAGVLLAEFLQKVGHTNFVNYIPHRHTQGYGFHTTAVTELCTQNVSLIITADVGIADVETVAYAADRGVDVIITDHHLPKEQLPKAIAIVNPQRKDCVYPNKHLCGSGVAFKLVQALLTHSRKEKRVWVDAITEGWEKWLLDLVAIATVGDMVELTGENRALVHFGILVLRKSKRPGIAALCKKLRLAKPFLTEDDIGFSIAPRINASSRMGSPETAFRLLATHHEQEAVSMAKELESLNNKRKGGVASIVRTLKERFDDHEANVLVAGNPHWNPALLGLAANSLVDTYGKTVCLWGREGTGSIKGSCRGNGDVGVVDLFTHMGEVLTQFGGHAHAGGFSVSGDNIYDIEKAFEDAYVQMPKTNMTQSVSPDAALPHDALEHTHRAIARMAPFGVGNPKPLFVYENAHVTSLRQFGKEGLHLEMQLRSGSLKEQIRAISFFKHPDSFTEKVTEGNQVNVIGTLELSRFMGRVQFELRVVDVV
tara:strand:+ start:9291 stop:10946 length:1656 start_codon:yes stop_codon:yes gene_type:complete